MINRHKFKICCEIRSGETKESLSAQLAWVYLNGRVLTRRLLGVVRQRDVGRMFQRGWYRGTPFECQARSSTPLYDRSPGSEFLPFCELEAGLQPALSPCFLRIPLGNDCPSTTFTLITYPTQLGPPSRFLSDFTMSLAAYFVPRIYTTSVYRSRCTLVRITQTSIWATSALSATALTNWESWRHDVLPGLAPDASKKRGGFVTARGSSGGFNISFMGECVGWSNSRDPDAQEVMKRRCELCELMLNT